MWNWGDLTTWGALTFWGSLDTSGLSLTTPRTAGGSTTRPDAGTTPRTELYL